MGPDDNLDSLRGLIEEITELKKLPRHSPEFKTWKNAVERLLGRMFGPDSIHFKQFQEIRFSLGFAISGMADSEFEKPFQEGLDESKLQLTTFADEYEADIDEKMEMPTKESINKKNVFIVHGHDETVLLKVKDFVKSFDLNPIILHEKADEGLTIIEKFEKHSDVGFAIILLTPDDVGYPIDNETKKMPRARQNVILEMGFFLGKLGRKGVRALYVEGVEIPSDYGSVLYIKFEGDEWKLKLAKEMRVAGLEIDLNKLAK